MIQSCVYFVVKKKHFCALVYTEFKNRKQNKKKLVRPILNNFIMYET